MTYSSPILLWDIRHNQLPISFNAVKKHGEIPSQKTIKKFHEEIELFEIKIWKVQGLQRFSNSLY